MQVPHSYTLNLGLTQEGGSEHIGQDLDDTNKGKRMQKRPYGQEMKLTI